ISLSSWVRDYIFASLPGDPQSKAARWRNTLAMMLAFGLWHGAAWTFVVWGLIHGALLVAYDAYGTLRRRLRHGYRPAIGPLATASSIAAMQFCVVIAMIPFRAPDLPTARKVLEKFVLYDVNFSFVGAGLSDIQASRALILIVVFALLHVLAYRVGRLERWLAAAPAPLAFAGCFALGVVAYYLWPLEEPAFIYLRF
ncbi:MAG: MBOAT family O-acyltransferase, partial [Candidatus Binatia bacterium]